MCTTVNTKSLLFNTEKSSQITFYFENVITMTETITLLIFLEKVEENILYAVFVVFPGHTTAQRRDTSASMRTSNSDRITKAKKRTLKMTCEFKKKPHTVLHDFLSYPICFLD